MEDLNEKMNFGMGWLRDIPDFRDFTSEHELVKPLLKKLKATGAASAPPSLPASVDLRPWCSPIENQGQLGSCTANAGAGVLEYFERRAFGKHIDASRLFVYKVSRKLLGWNGDTGCFLRTTMAGMTLFGAPPERYWPYVVPQFDVEPPTFVYSLAQNYQATRYYRYDPPGTAYDANFITRLKNSLAAGLPMMFGFTVYNSISQANSSGKIPLPTAHESVAGGHAIDCVGYDDHITIKNTNPGAVQTTGAILIRNSWGTGWGMAGYGYLPYEYLLRGLTSDWWSLISAEYVDTGQFGL